MDEVIKWIDPQSDVPDDGIEVLILGQQHEGDFLHQVFVGFWDSADDCWRTAEGWPMVSVTHWAEMPAGPKVLL
jgi:hypothetical protein